MPLHNHKTAAAKKQKSGGNHQKIPPHGDTVVKAPAVTFKTGNTDK